MGIRDITITTEDTVSDNGYTVMVKWVTARRAERLTNGTTTTKRMHAIVFPTSQAADTAAHQALDCIAGIERWWVAPF